MLELYWIQTLLLLHHHHHHHDHCHSHHCHCYHHHHHYQIIISSSLANSVSLKWKILYKPEDSIKLETNLNSDLSRLKEYLNLNRLSINVAKCEFMLIGTYQAVKKILNKNVHIDGETYQ